MFKEGVLFGFVITLILLYIRTKYVKLTDYNTSLNNVIDELKFNRIQMKKYKEYCELTLIPLLQEDKLDINIRKLIINNNFYNKHITNYSIYNILSHNDIIDLNQIMYADYEKYTDNIDKLINDYLKEDSDILKRYSSTTEEETYRDKLKGVINVVNFTNEHLESYVNQLEKLTGILQTKMINANYCWNYIEEKLKKVI